MNSISKVYVATGWRVGHISIHDPEDKFQTLKEKMRANTAAAGAIPTPIAFGAMAAYDGTMGHIPAMNRALTGRRNLSHRRLNEIERLSASRPQAAFFIFPRFESETWRDDYHFARELKKEARIEVNPGSNYGDAHSLNHFRIPYLPGEDVLTEIYDRLEEFMKKKIK